jgi:hypothetical protein
MFPRNLLQAKEAADHLLDLVYHADRAALAVSLDAAYAEGQEKKQEVQTYEDRLQEHEVKSAVWAEYLDSFPEYNLYERAVIDCGMEEHFWLRYHDWLQSFGLDSTTQYVVRSMSSVAYASRQSPIL